ncbi:hypothetical protein C6P46_006356 [Rhodotorula mucilaginosa]|uniref:Uncharacterized protein n=1 Tax=Rhodotorula mucilaginosa TaxID=5537 RepID=A0A9P6W601_RHOMI|nr:hypothetical protein C6P46_006356 [Rhodotorula mucilaginosa]
MSFWRNVRSQTSSGAESSRQGGSSSSSRGSAAAKAGVEQVVVLADCSSLPALRIRSAERGRYTETRLRLKAEDQIRRFEPLSASSPSELDFAPATARLASRLVLVRVREGLVLATSLDHRYSLATPEFILPLSVPGLITDRICKAFATLHARQAAGWSDSPFITSFGPASLSLSHAHGCLEKRSVSRWSTTGLLRQGHFPLCLPPALPAPTVSRRRQSTRRDAFSTQRTVALLSFCASGRSSTQ